MSHRVLRFLRQAFCAWNSPINARSSSVSSLDILCSAFCRQTT